jgi:uncharacterized protein (TIGR02646 family)
MTPFSRQPPPSFWSAKEQQWAKLAPASQERNPLDWRHQKRTLRAWFHALVRPDTEPRMCAYCDGPLLEQSRETIDHFLPRHAFPELSLAWANLFPACDRCNSTNKRERWSCHLVRPDTDPVDTWFDVDRLTGRLRASPELDRPTRARIRLTIRVFLLNDNPRCLGRLRVMNEMENAARRDHKTLARDQATLEERATRGPYRFVARRVLDTLPPSARDPIASAR